jgi:hypothetical protein
MFSAPFLTTLLDRVKAIVRRVARPVAKPVSPVPARAPEVAISPVLRGIAQGWLRTKLGALSALMRRIEAGEKLNMPLRAPITARDETALVMRGAVPPETRLPRGFGWMCAFEPNMREDGAAFAAWLDEPWMKARVLTAPEKMVRVVGPILNATGAPRPEWFPVVVKRPQQQAVPAGGTCDTHSGEIRISSPPGLDSAPDLARPSPHTPEAVAVARDRRVKPGDEGYRGAPISWQGAAVRGLDQSPWCTIVNRITNESLSKNCDEVFGTLSHGHFVSMCYRKSIRFAPAA